MSAVIRWRPTPPAPGVRPPRDEQVVTRRCALPGCGVEFNLDRRVQPWARARTCSPGCARRLGHRNRRPGNVHAELVLGYRLQRAADVERIEVAGRDEDARPVTFRGWLEAGAGRVTCGEAA